MAAILKQQKHKQMEYCQVNKVIAFIRVNSIRNASINIHLKKSTAEQLALDHGMFLIRSFGFFFVEKSI